MTGTTLVPDTSRRSVLRGAVWSVPVVAAASAIPAAAASPAVAPDLVITTFANAAQDGIVQSTGTPTGEPGYFQDKPLFFHLSVTNFGDVPATMFTARIQLSMVSYKNGSATVNADSTDIGWNLLPAAPSGTDVILPLTWTGSLAPGATTTIYVNYQVNENPGETWTVVTTGAVIMTVDPAESRTDNNFQQGAPNYWVRNAHPNLALTHFANAPADGVVQSTDTPNGQPGYYQNKPLFFAATVANFGEVPATSFTLNIQLPMISYRNDTAGINQETSGPGWVAQAPYPFGDGWVVIPVTWTGSLPTGASTSVYVNFWVNENPGSTWQAVNTSASIRNAVPSESDTTDNSLAGAPQYWVRTV